MELLIKKVDLDNQTELLVKPDYITDERWQKIQKMKTDADKNRSLASGFLLDMMCKRLGIENPRYVHTNKGKLYLDGERNVAFNLSHSGEYAALVYHDTEEAIGIDIQQIRSMREGMERRILSEEELLHYGNLKNKDLKESILYLNRVWTVKESYVKMTGDGISVDFRKITIDFEGKTIVPEENEAVSFNLYEKISGYILAVSIAKLSDFAIKYYK